MSQNPLRLLFESERRILARRLKQFFPSRVGPDTTQVIETAPNERVKPPPIAATPNEPTAAELERAKKLIAPAETPVVVEPALAAASADRIGPYERRSLNAVGLVTSLAFHLILLVVSTLCILSFDSPPAAEHWVDIRYTVAGRTSQPTLSSPTTEAPPAETPPPPPVTQSDPTDPLIAAVAPAPVAIDSQLDGRGNAEAEPTNEPNQNVSASSSSATATPVVGVGSESRGGHGDGDSGLGGRVGDHAGALEKFGGGAETELAVSEGLEWLAQHQDENGTWDAQRFHRHCGGNARRCTGDGFREYSTGVSALALLAFLGAGIDGTSASPHRDTVARGLSALLAAQDSIGCFGPRDGNYMYNHGIAAFCMTEAAILTGNSLYREAAARALRFAAAAQQAGGGWDYTAQATGRNDLSVTGWLVMAIHAAREVAIDIDPTMLARLDGFIRRAVQPSGWSIYADRGTGANRGGISIAAVGMLSKIYLGWSLRGREMQRTADLIVRHPPDLARRVDWESSYQSSYYWYYATLALFHVGGEHWEAWNTYIRRTVLPARHLEGHRKGSWDPDPNWIGACGGRVATTALCVLTFEVYYRYTPLNEKFGHRGAERTLVEPAPRTERP
ncbi:MAG: hypothetical protein ACKVX7_16545 [Planctomycetota bacterium]